MAVPLRLSLFFWWQAACFTGSFSTLRVFPYFSIFPYISRGHTLMQRLWSYFYSVPLPFALVRSHYCPKIVDAHIYELGAISRVSLLDSEFDMHKKIGIGSSFGCTFAFLFPVTFYPDQIKWYITKYNPRFSLASNIGVCKSMQSSFIT